MRAPVFTGAGFDLVARAHREDGLYALVLLHRALRHQDHAGAVLGNIADAPELAGKQPVLRIGEFGLQLQRAGPRVHLIERVRHFAGLRKHRVIGQNQLRASGLPSPARPSFP